MKTHSSKLLLLALMLSINPAHAQIYTATAGSNGSTEINSAYAMSTGDGASVSVDVPLEFTLGQRLEVHYVDSDGNQTLDNGYVVPGSSTAFTYNSQVTNGQTAQYFEVNSAINIGGVDTLNVTITSGKLIHEAGTGSGEIDVISPSRAIVRNTGTNAVILDEFTNSFQLISSDFNNSDGWAHVQVLHRPDPATIDSNDRPGIYTAETTITYSLP